MQEHKRKIEHDKLTAQSGELILRFLQGCSARTKLRRHIKTELQTNLDSLDKLATIFYAQKSQVFQLPFDKLLLLVRHFLFTVDASKAQEAYAKKRG